MWMHHHYCRIYEDGTYDFPVTVPMGILKEKKRIRYDSGKIQLLLDLRVLQALFGFPAIFRRDINTDIPSL